MEERERRKEGWRRGRERGMREKKEGKKKEKDEIERERGEKKKRKKREWVIYKKGRREGGAKDRKDEKKKEKKRVNLYSHFSHMPDEESLIQIKAVVQVVVTKFLPNVHAIVTCMKNKKKKSKPVYLCISLNIQDMLLG